MQTLIRQAQTRTPELVPIRNGRMLRTPFTFFRGAAAIMADDLAATPATGIRAQLCGDAHLSNFGGYAAPDRSLVFDVNDFDETLPGPWEWDVKRLAASIAVAGRDRGFERGARGDAVRGAVRAYREAMLTFAGERTIDVWYARLDLEKQFSRWGERVDDASRKVLDKALEKARRKDSVRALRKLTYEVDGEPRIISDPPLVVPIRDMVAPDEAEHLRVSLVHDLDEYKRSLQPERRHLLDHYTAVDVAHKVVGVGSVGMRAWIVLLLGRDRSDPLFLQVKEADRSVLAPFAGRSRQVNQGRRVVDGQRLMQAASDVFLGWARVAADPDGDTAHRDYYVRQLWDAKLSAPIDRMSAAQLAAYSETCGWTLARAHARSGDRFAIAAYLGKGDRLERALTTFAEAYADQNERDHAAFAAAAQAGLVPVDLEY